MVYLLVVAVNGTGLSGQSALYLFPRVKGDAQFSLIHLTWKSF